MAGKRVFPHNRVDNRQFIEDFRRKRGLFSAGVRNSLGKRRENRGFREQSHKIYVRFEFFRAFPRGFPWKCVLFGPFDGKKLANFLEKPGVFPRARHERNRAKIWGKTRDFADFRRKRREFWGKSRFSTGKVRKFAIFSGFWGGNSGESLEKTRNLRDFQAETHNLSRFCSSRGGWQRANPGNNGKSVVFRRKSRFFQ